MRQHMIFTGDINLIGVDDAGLTFGRVADRLRGTDLVLGNLECCLYDPPQTRTMMAGDVSGFEGLYARAKNGGALKFAGFHGIGNANNQNYGADAILASNQRLNELGIAHSGAGANRAEARAPVVLERNGVRYGFLQRTSQYWPNNHEAGEAVAGVATLKAYTAYQPPYYKTGGVPPNRPGMPATVITWTDPEQLVQYRSDITALKKQADIVIASHHWGYGEEILQYQREIAHAAIDAGADVVIGHGPHFPLAVEMHRGRPIYYGLGMFCFIRSNKKAHTGWTGMTANLTFEDRRLTRAAYSLVRQNDRTEILLRAPCEEPEQAQRIVRLSERFGTGIVEEGDEAVFWRA